ncbi:MAG TPA: hypothetical protein PKK43_10605 [Spirochaetota bacterium]|nr:hypothetical protein [Spirochaetota bacterium]
MDERCFVRLWRIDASPPSRVRSGRVDPPAGVRKHRTKKVTASPALTSSH